MAGENILVVEDNVMNLKLVRILLEQQEYIVTEALNAEEALEILKYRHFDLILMDIQLPKMDGLTLTKMLKEDPRTRDIPVVALTAHAMRGDEQKAQAAGCVGYIPKPIDTIEFPKLIEKFLRE
ncbi:MAG TPA: response regulator [Thermoplasmata archaeon]|nr:response regulator [Thermoplasmata archaeon]